jgi:hypothetical protein
MRNPLRSEAEAFRFLIVTIVFFGAIVAARLLMGTIVALLVAIAGIALIGWLLRGGGKAEPQPPRLVVRDLEPPSSRQNGVAAREQDPAERT